MAQPLPRANDIDRFKAEPSTTPSTMSHRRPPGWRRRQRSGGIEAHGVLSQISIHPRQYYTAPRADVRGITALLAEVCSASSASAVWSSSHTPCVPGRRAHARSAGRRCLRQQRTQSRRMLVSATAWLQQLARHI